MGLDGVELVMAVEQRFGIVIKDAEAERTATPGQLIELVMTKVKVGGEQRCRSQRAFYLLRRALVKMQIFRREEIRPNTSMSKIAFKPDWERYWLELKSQTGAVVWPKAPRLIRWKFLLLAGLASLSLVLMVKMTGMVAGICAGLALLFAWVVFNKFYVLRGPSWQTQHFTVESLIPYVCSSPDFSWSRPQVAKEVQQIVEDILGLPPGKYREDAEFVKDLGMD